MAIAAGAWAQDNSNLPAKETVLYRFQGGADGGVPQGALIRDGNGNLYGTTDSTIFKLARNPDGSWSETVLVELPVPLTNFSVIADPAGNLYAVDGGEALEASEVNGVWSAKTIYTFDGNSDGLPNGGLIRDTADNLYGVTIGGGTYGYGTVYELSPNPEGSWTHTILYSFTNQGDGDNPAYSLSFGPDGNLYGVVDDNANGHIFELIRNPDGSWREQTIYTFTLPNGLGSYPRGSLIFDNAGHVYGATAGGGLGFGTIFELAPNPDGTWSESILATPNWLDGSTPSGGLVMDAAGNLYGLTDTGGLHLCRLGQGCGVAYKLSPTGQSGQWTYQVLHRFGLPADGAYDGARPIGELIFDPNGNLYGVTRGGGSAQGDYGEGTVFELTPR